MKVLPSDLEQIAKNFLSSLDREKINSNVSLKNRMGETIQLDKYNDFITFELRPSNFGTQAYTISYTRLNTGIPIELKVNESLDYSQIILKVHKTLEGYFVFAIDPFGSIVQNKVIYTSDFTSVKKELERLCNLSGL